MHKMIEIIASDFGVVGSIDGCVFGVDSQSFGHVSLPLRGSLQFFEYCQIKGKISSSIACI
jgi:hypothetical protein